MTDLTTFAKVRAVYDRTDSPGEKAAAAGRMDALARAAGMTTAEAVSKLDTPTKPAAGPSFADIFDTPFFRQAKAKADRARAEKWRQVLCEYGSEETLFAPTPWEVALEQACDRFVVKRTTTGWRIGSLWGWDLFSLGRPAPEIEEAVSQAYPMPRNVQEAWSEFIAWDKLCRDREARSSGAGDPEPWVRVRTDLIERQLDTMPAHSLSDLRARMDWMDWRNDLESAPDPKEERIRLATLRADIERMGARMEDARAPVQSGHRHPTTADKRRDVIALMGSGLSDREISRRVGVSPTTVGTIRRTHETKAPNDGDHPCP